MAVLLDRSTSRGWGCGSTIARRQLVQQGCLSLIGGMLVPLTILWIIAEGLEIKIVARRV